MANILRIFWALSFKNIFLEACIIVFALLVLIWVKNDGLAMGGGESGHWERARKVLSKLVVLIQVALQ